MNTKKYKLVVTFIMNDEDMWKHFEQAASANSNNIKSMSFNFINITTIEYHPITGDEYR